MLTRCRVQLLGNRTLEMVQLERLLEDASIKRSTSLTDTRSILEAPASPAPAQIAKFPNPNKVVGAAGRKTD